ncbi:ankyrin repeat-containing domain protein [Pyronema omphalodes]|nr:ankyrin repeat-containing domain protein [Pyronema omphalodes]
MYKENTTARHSRLGTGILCGVQPRTHLLGTSSRASRRHNNNKQFLPPNRKTNMALTTLPVEILFEIGDHSNLNSLAALCLVNHRFRNAFEQCLYRRGAKMSDILDDGTTNNFNPSVWAIDNNRISVMQKLLEHGLNGNLRIGNKTLLQISISSAIHNANDEYSRDTTITKLLLENGAEPDAQDCSGYTSLHFAVRFGWHYKQGLSETWIKMLLEHGASVDAKNMWTKTPLHLAVILGNLEAARMLLDSGADINIPDNEGRTALGIARRDKKSVEMENMLRDYGARLEETELI